MHSGKRSILHLLLAPSPSPLRWKRWKRWVVGGGGGGSGGG